MPVVVDNNVLSSLGKIDRLELLRDLFSDVATTPSVLDELHRDAVAGYQFVDRIDAVKSFEGGWLGIHSPTEREIVLTGEILDSSLSYTDAECIAVAEHQNVALLTDDGHVGEIASQRNVEVWDLPLFVEACIRRDLVADAADLEDLLDELRAKDHYRFSDQDRDRLFEYF